MNFATISVIIAVFNGEKYLDQAIQSILGQSLSATEILIVDDGSTDSSPEVARSFPGVKYYRKENGGSGSARNYGINRSSGEFIAFLDADDLWLPNKLQSQVEYLRQHPDAGYAVCLQRMFLEAGNTPPSWIKPELFHSQHPAFVPSAMTVRKVFFERIGTFDESLRSGYDQDWFARAHADGQGMHVVPELLIERRIHSDNESGSQAALRNLLRVAKNSIDRNRDLSHTPPAATK